MTRGIIAACAATLVTAGTLAWVGFKLLALPTHGSAVAESIAGGGGERRFAAALHLFADSVHETARTDAAFVRRARAEAALAAQRGDPQVRARAETLLGVLALRDAAAQPRRAAAFTGTALTAFRTALRLDPDNEEAAADLELLLTRRGGKQHGQPGGARKRGAHKAHARQHGRGAGASATHGGGYCARPSISSRRWRPSPRRRRSYPRRPRCCTRAAGHGCSRPWG
jgi:hypothetical protein